MVTTYGAGGYTGAAFDTYGDNDPVRIGADDLIAVSMLSIQIREQSASALRSTSILALDSLAGAITELLAALPTDRDLHTLSESEFDRWLGRRFCRRRSVLAAAEAGRDPAGGGVQAIGAETPGAVPDPRHRRREGPRSDGRPVVAALVGNPDRRPQGGGASG